MNKTLPPILFASSLAFITIFCIFTLFIPQCVNNSYDILNEKFSTTENVILSSTRSVAKGFEELTDDLNTMTDPDHLAVSELKYTSEKIIGIVHNNSQYSIESIEATVIITDSSGALKDVVSTEVSGFGILKSGTTGYFYTDDINIDSGSGDTFTLKLVSASRSLFEAQN